MAGEPGYATTTTNAIATANGLYSSGGAVGSLLIMWAAMTLGRKLNIQLGAVLAIIGGALQGGAAGLAYVFLNLAWSNLTFCIGCSKPDVSSPVLLLAS